MTSSVHRVTYRIPVTRRGLAMTPSCFGSAVLAGRHRVCPAG